MSDGGRRVCGHCGAPLRDLVDGECPFCRTRVYTDAGPRGGAPVATAHAVVMLDAGTRKIEVIKELRELSIAEGAGLGLKEAKDLVDAANPHTPPVLVVDLDAERARHWGQTLAKAGAHVQVHPPFGAPAPPPPGPAAATTVPHAFAIVLLASGRKKINVIKEVREMTGLGLKEAKDLVDRADRQPQVVLHGIGGDDARRGVVRLEGAGATVEIRPV